MSSSLHIAALLLVTWVCTCVGADEGEASNNLQGGEREAKFGGIGAPTSLIANMARELISNSYSNSQVLSLNLSNVLILLLLKAVLFSIGHFSAGGGKLGGFFGRADPYDQQPRGLEDGVTEGELVLLLSYLTGERRGDFGCLYRVACQEPGGRAPQYLAASKMLLKASSVVSSVVTVNPKYSRIVEGLEEAVKVGATSGDCSRYQCALKQ